MNKPNLFDYAKKELSQDAIIMWLFECARSEEAQYIRIGKTFIKELLDIQDDVLVYWIESQYKRIDVYAEIIVGEQVHPVIIEDKTDSQLSENQLVKYCEKINKQCNEKWLNNICDKVKKNLVKGDTYCAVIKTGYLDIIFKNDLEKQIKNIKHNDNVNFKLVTLRNNKKTLSLDDNKIKNKNILDIMTGIKEISGNNWIIKDYFEYINNEKKEFEKIVNNELNDISYNKNLREDNSSFTHELVWKKILRKPFYRMGHSASIIHTFSEIETNVIEKEYDIHFNLRLEKIFTKKYEGHIISFELYSKTEHDSKKRDAFYSLKNIILECKDGYIEKYIYSLKEDYTNNDSNKILVLKFVDDNNKFIQWDKLKEFIDKVQRRCK